MLPWKREAHRLRRLLKAELSGSRRLYLALVKAKRELLEAQKDYGLPEAWQRPICACESCQVDRAAKDNGEQ